MARALIITPEITASIEAAVERARQHPVSWETMRQFAVPVHVTELKLSDRAPGFERKIKSQFIDIPDGYLAAISFEEQPAGLIRHLSVSVDTKGSLPSVPAVNMIAEAFGFALPLDNTMAMMWLEEFEPGHQAVNVVQVEPKGRA